MPYHKPKGQLGDSREVPEGKATSWQIKEKIRQEAMDSNPKPH